MPAWMAWYLFATWGQGARDAEARAAGPVFAERLAQHRLYAEVEETSDGENAA